MQKFFELEELHPADRDWTNRDGNGKGAGSLSVSGRFVWTPAAADDDGDDDGTDVSTPSGNGAGGGGNVNGIDKAGGKDSDAKGGNGSSSGTKSVTTSGKVGGTRGSSGSGDYSSVSARALAATPRKPKAAAVGPTVSVEKGEKPPPGENRRCARARAAAPGEVKGGRRIGRGVGRQEPRQEKGGLIGDMRGLGGALR